MTGQDAERLPLFAFGTLRRGEANHHYLAGRYERVLQARLPGYAVVAPLAIDCDEASAVPGELFFLRPGDHDETMTACDALEGIEPGRTAGMFYERRRARVLTAVGPYEAWAYVTPSRDDRWAAE